MKLNLGVVFGGNSVEHDVSILTALSAIRFLNHDKFNFIPLYYAKNQRFYTGSAAGEITTYQKLDKIDQLLDEVIFSKEVNGVYLKYKKWYKPKQSIDMIFPMLHGSSGEDGTFQGFLDTLDLPYCESSTKSCAMIQDKEMMHQILSFHELPAVSWIVVNRHQLINQENCFQEVLKPWIIKPASGGSSIGIKCVDDEKDLLNAALECALFDEKIIIEHRLTDFREFNLGCIGDQDEIITSQIEEVFKSETILSYTDKYGQSSIKGMEAAKRMIPAAIEEELAEKIIQMGKKVFQAFACNGIVRIDFLYDNLTQQLYVNEINAIPGSLALYLFKDIKREELLDLCIKYGLQKYRRKKNRIVDIESNVLNYGFSGIKK